MNKTFIRQKKMVSFQYSKNLSYRLSTLLCNYRIKWSFSDAFEWRHWRSCHKIFVKANSCSKPLKSPLRDDWIRVQYRVLKCLLRTKNSYTLASTNTSKSDVQSVLFMKSLNFKVWYRNMTRKQKRWSLLLKRGSWCRVTKYLPNVLRTFAPFPRCMISILAQ